MKHIVIIGALPISLVNFRGDLIASLIHAGYRVTAMASPAKLDVIQDVEALGASYRSYPVNRRSINPINDFLTFLSLRKAFSEMKPDIVLAYTIKPVVWSGIAVKGIQNINFFALVEGLGYAFQVGTLKRRILTSVATILYKISLRNAARIIFLNSDNCKFFLEKGLVNQANCSKVDGIGVDLKKFSFSSTPLSDPVFLSIGRLLGEKGFREFARAAGLVKAKYPQVRFQILGGEDPSSDGIPLQEIKEWEDKGWVDYLGETSDVRPFLNACNVYVLASYHEGMPRTVMEAMAMGRPIITTDAAGCRETVQEGKNGFLVPVKDAQALAERMIWFIQNPDSMEQMGRESRRMAEERFDVRIINQRMMEIMGLVR